MKSGTVNDGKLPATDFTLLATKSGTAEVRIKWGKMIR